MVIADMMDIKNILKDFSRLAEARKNHTFRTRLVFIFCAATIAMVLFFSYRVVNSAMDKILVVNEGGELLRFKAMQQDLLYESLLKNHCYHTAYYLNSFDRLSLQENRARALFLVNKPDANTIFAKYQEDTDSQRGYRHTYHATFSGEHFRIFLPDIQPAIRDAMTKTERSRIVALGGIGAVIILLVWGIIATLPKKEDGREEEVRLRSEIKDNFTLKDMLGSVEKEMENRRENRMPGGGNYGMDEPEDTVSPESEIQRIRELIRRNEQTLGSGPLSGTEQPAPSAFREKETTDGEEEKLRKTEPEDTVPEETPRRGFNSVRLVRQDERNVIRAFVHSTQTVMVGATLKMQLAENCLTDDGQRIRKGTPVFGEVTGIDGERVLVKITSVNLAGNILPFEKEVYSEDAMEGIYVPGNAKAETIKEAEAAGVSGTNTSISGGLDMGSQIVAGAANSVINATKSAASKNIRKIKVTIKTNYRILLKDAKK